MATFDSDGPAWTATERTRRTVALNPPEALRDLLQLVASILSKILDNPGEDKYRSLKQSSRVCQQRLLGRPGGRELLASLGFKSGTCAGQRSRCQASTTRRFGQPSPGALRSSRRAARRARDPGCRRARDLAAFSTDETLRDARAYADACAPKGAPADLGQAGGIRFDDARSTKRSRRWARERR